MVSIIIPTFNDSEHLIKTIASCLVQNTDTEIIVVNDASTKPISENVLNFMAVVGVHYMVHLENKGLAESRIRE